MSPNNASIGQENTKSTLAQTEADALSLIPEEWFTVDQAVDYLNQRMPVLAIKAGTLRQYIHREQIGHWHVAGRIYLQESQLDHFLQDSIQKVDPKWRTEGGQ